MKEQYGFDEPQNPESLTVSAPACMVEKSYISYRYK